MRRLLPPLLLLLVLPARAGEKTFEDDTHPRSPGTPLNVVFTPYSCTRCVAEDEKPKSIELLRMPMDELAKTLGLEPGSWIAIESPHFRLLSTLKASKVKLKDSRFARADLERLKTIFPKFTVGRDGAYLDPHERAHLYHIRVERLYAHFQALTDCQKPFLGMLAPYQVFLFDDYAEHHALVDKFVGAANDKAGNQHHDKEPPNFMAFTTAEGQVARDQGKGDGIFAAHVNHNVAHNLMDGHNNYYRETWGWLEEGIAHYYERREQEKHNTFCWSEGRPPNDFQKPDWESVIFGLVRRGRDDPLGNWCEKLQPGQLTGTQNGMSWSIVKWLIETEPVRLTKLLERVDDREQKPTAEQCIEYAFGVSPTVLHQRWRDYVMKAYAPTK
jgi:hypothetical protein